MNKPMNLINLKMATAVAAVLTVVASLAPDAANAVLRRADQDSLVGNGNLSFILNTSDMDSSSDPNTGQYTAAIKNLTVTFPRGQLTLQASVPSVILHASRVDPEQLPPPNSNTRPILTPITGFIAFPELVRYT